MIVCTLTALLLSRNYIIVGFASSLPVVPYKIVLDYFRIVNFS